MQSQYDALAANNSQAGIKRPIEAGKEYRGKVVDVVDKSKHGKVKVWIPDLMTNNVTDNDGIWALPANNSFSGNDESKEIGIDDCGTCIVPPKGSYVTITFEDGDFNKPRYRCGFNLDIDAAIPVENQAGLEFYNKWTVLKSPKGRQILISDDSSDESIILRGKYKNRGKRAATSDPRQPSDSRYIYIWEKAGQESIVIKDSIGQYFLMDEANKKIRFQHVSGSYIEFTADGDIKIQAAKNIHLNEGTASLQSLVQSGTQAVSAQASVTSIVSGSTPVGLTSISSVAESATQSLSQATSMITGATSLSSMVPSLPSLPGVPALPTVPSIPGMSSITSAMPSSISMPSEIASLTGGLETFSESPIASLSDQAVDDILKEVPSELKSIIQEQLKGI